MAKLNGNVLTVDGEQYKVRYTTPTTIVCDTDKLNGKFGDEFSIKDISKEK